MIIVLAIIALVAALIVPSVIGRPDQARVAVAGADLKTIAAALKMYRLDNGSYPTSAQGLAALVNRPVTGPATPAWAA
ncbi:MAG: type II secretion system protein GspG, partial [Janthinobacterium lividum]